MNCSYFQVVYKFHFFIFPFPLIHFPNLLQLLIQFHLTVYLHFWFIRLLNQLLISSN